MPALNLFALIVESRSKDNRVTESTMVKIKNLFYNLENSHIGKVFFEAI